MEKKKRKKKRMPTELRGHVVQADVVGGSSVRAVRETGQEPVTQQA